MPTDRVSPPEWAVTLIGAAAVHAVTETGIELTGHHQNRPATGTRQGQRLSPGCRWTFILRTGLVKTVSVAQTKSDRGQVALHCLPC